MKLRGTVLTGLGRAAKYITMPQYQQRFEDLLGWQAYPGTFNIEVEPARRRQVLDAIDPLEIRDVTHDGEHVSDVDLYPIEIDGIEAAILDLEITDHPDSVVEIIAPKNLRDALEVEDGDEIICTTMR